MDFIAIEKKVAELKGKIEELAGLIEYKSRNISWALPGEVGLYMEEIEKLKKEIEYLEEEGRLAEDDLLREDYDDLALQGRLARQEEMEGVIERDSVAYYEGVGSFPEDEEYNPSLEPTEVGSPEEQEAALGALLRSVSAVAAAKLEADSPVGLTGLETQRLRELEAELKKLREREEAIGWDIRDHLAFRAENRDEGDALAAASRSLGRRIGDLKKEIAELEAKAKG